MTPRRVKRMKGLNVCHRWSITSDQTVANDESRLQIKPWPVAWPQSHGSERPNKGRNTQQGSVDGGAGMRGDA